MKKLLPATPEQEEAKKAYYGMTDAIYGLDNIAGFDPKMKASLLEKADELKKHLDKNYPNWD